ncbi:diacylglycerol kinase family lipid kinase [soil metagenome]
MSPPTSPPTHAAHISPPDGRPPALVIFNPSAGEKRPLGGKVTQEQITELLAGRGLAFEIVASRTAQEAPRRAATAVAEGRPLVVAAGGDGTIGAIASELLGTEAALGILPLGSVMNVPRMLGLPRDLEEAADVLAAGHTRLVDVGEANGQLFYEAASVGLNVTIFNAAERLVERDFLSVKRLFWIALRYRPGRITLHLDGEIVNTRALMVTVSNGPYTGLGMTVAPAARLDDGQFDVRVFRHYSKFDLLRHLLSISFGRRQYLPHSRTYRAASVRIEAPRSLPVRADGQNLGRTPLQCTVRSEALRVVVPANAEAAEDSAAG